MHWSNLKNSDMNFSRWKAGFKSALLVAVEWFALLALAVIWAWQPEERTRRRFLRIVVALWGTTAFGMYHQILAYVIMVAFSERDWDEPPGTGYLTVATITISAVLTAIMTLRTRRKVADNEQQQDDDSGSLTPALATHCPQLCWLALDLK